MPTSIDKVQTTSGFKTRSDIPTPQVSKSKPTLSQRVSESDDVKKLKEIESLQGNFEKVTKKVNLR